MAKIRFYLLFILSASLFFSACEEENPPSPPSGGPINFSSSPIDLQGIDAKFAKNISYGDHAKNTFDIFLPNSSQATPVIIFIHGGGFTSGEKEVLYQTGGGEDYPAEIRNYLNNNIAVASINYRLLDENDTEGVLKPLNDSKRCLQYIRSIAQDLNINKSQVALSGGSAGGGTALWLAFSPDMRKANDADPVLRESTRVLGVAANETQASYDLATWQTKVFAEYGLDLLALANADADLQKRFNSFYGLSNFSEFDSQENQTYRARVDMLSLMTADDPSFWANNTREAVVSPNDLNLLFHHAYHVRELQRKANSMGLANVCYYGNTPDPSGETREEYLLRILGK